MAEVVEVPRERPRKNVPRWLRWGLGLGCALVAGFAWALASPIGSSPDEDYHMTSIWCPPPIEKSGCTVQYRSDGAPMVLVPQQVAVAPHCYAFHPEVPGSCTGDLSVTMMVATIRVDTGAYPGPYYRFMHIFVTKSVMASVVLMRFVNVFIAVLMGALLAWAIPAASRTALFWTVAGGVVPLGLFIVASINPSSWTIVGVTAFTVALDSMLRAPTRRAALGCGGVALLGTVLAATSRADGALCLLLCVVAVAALGFRRIRSRLQFIGVAIFAAGLALWSLTSSSQTSMANSGLGTNKITWAKDINITNVMELPGLWSGIFATPGWGLGWLDTAMPAVVWLPLILCAAALVTTGLRRSRLWQVSVSVGLFLVVAGVIPVYLLSKTADIIGINYQPRYLLPIFFAALFLLLRPQQDYVPEPVIPGRAAAILVTVFVLTQAIALLFLLRRYTVGTNGYLWNLTHVSWWWTKGFPGPFVAWVAASLAYGVLVLMLSGLDVRTAAARSRERLRGAVAAIRQPRRNGRDLEATATDSGSAESEQAL